MSETARITISRFQPQDQAEVRALVLAGLGEHWGFIDYGANPDLDNIASSYANDLFLVARQGDTIVGTGAIRFEGRRVGRIVRMSVARDLRRRGIGRLILKRLEEQARRVALHTLVLETTATWTAVMAFYKDSGFTITHTDGENVHFVFHLNAQVDAISANDLRDLPKP